MLKIFIILLGIVPLAAIAAEPAPMITLNMTVQETSIIIEALFGNYPPVKSALPLIQKLQDEAQKALAASAHAPAASPGGKE